jgi:hypothetical protein
MKRDLFEILFILMITEIWIWIGVMGGDCNFCMQSDTEYFGKAICDKQCTGSICACFGSNQAACINYNVTITLILKFLMVVDVVIMVETPSSSKKNENTCS